MANLDSATAGSIAEHDILLSISEEAINRQLKMLYDKPISVANNQPPPPGLKLKSGASTVPSKYYINHELQIFNQHIDEETGKIGFDPDAGLFAHVQCPQIGLTEDESNTARISFTFERLEGAKTPDSEFHYYVGAGRDAKLRSQTVNGWTMSWRVRIGEEKFGDVQQEIVKPAQDSSSPVVAHPATVEALTGIDPKEFTVAAIFCMFEDVLLANSFEVKDENGQKQSDGVDDLMKNVSRYFTDVQDAAGHGKPTADSPFVLGYSLSQTVPDLKSVNPDAQTDNTPKCFIPKGYQMTVTPGYTYDGGQRQDSKYTRGTLNFCILTFRDADDNGRDPAKTDMKQNTNSGKLSKTLFDLTKTNQHDGIVAFAEDIIFKRLLGPHFVTVYAIDIEHVTKDMSADLKKLSSIASKWGQTDGNPPNFEYRTDFDFRTTREGGLFSAVCVTKGWTFARISWESDLQMNANIEAKDAVRKVYMTMHNEINIKINYGGIQEFDAGGNYESHLDVAIKDVWEISAGKGGILDIQKNDSKSVFLERGPDDMIKYQDGPRGSQYGAYLTTNNDRVMPWDITGGIWAKESSLLTSMMKDGIQATFTNSMANSASGTVTDNMTKTANSLRNRVIMPAGNVFNFAGVDVDSQGNMFAHISFALGAEGVSVDKGK